MKQAMLKLMPFDMTTNVTATIKRYNSDSVLPSCKTGDFFRRYADRKVSSIDVGL